MEKPLGKVRINDEVIAGIAGIAALKVDGVVGLSGGITDGIAKLLTGGQLTKGVKVETGKEECAIDISLIIAYGVRIIDVCFNVQEEVKNAVSQMTGLRVVEVNVFVDGVDEGFKERRQLK